MIKKMHILNVKNEIPKASLLQDSILLIKIVQTNTHFWSGALEIVIKEILKQM